MNIDDSKKSKLCAVKSKYFTGNSKMDDSLSDFQEPKKSCAGPKKAAKPKHSKAKKAPIRLRGQKDIRTVIQSTTKELKSYSKDFDKVCKKAGIDVDSEDLQLAIALSKSLQDTTSISNESVESSCAVTSQERIGKIRTTLQEYGFKVPVVKIATNTRKVRKHRKNYKLIHTSETEKKEIIADKYAQVLFQNISHCSLYCRDIDTSDIPIFYLASNASYNLLRVRDTFYVDNLVESNLTTGNLLRDWSSIPGRPESPRLFEPMKMNFSEIECSQDELDIVLSGTIKRCKDIVSKKINNWNNDNVCSMVLKNKCFDEKVEEINANNQNQILVKVSKDVEHGIRQIAKSKERRSCSPDLFDDDASDFFDESKNLSEEKNLSLSETNKEQNTGIEIMDLTQPVYEKSQYKQNYSYNITKRKSNDIMELTQCIQIQPEIEISSQLSQKTNETKRKSNDFMEITECVATESQSLQKNIDLTQSPDLVEVNENVTNKVIKINNIASSLEDNDIDLTISPEINKDKFVVPNKSSNTTNEIKAIESMDLTQSSNNSDELPFVSLLSQKDKIICLDDTIIVDNNDYAHVNKRLILDTEALASLEHIDLTECKKIDNDVVIHSQSFFEEYNHDHSKSTEEAKETNTDIIMHEEYSDNVDLTQSPVPKASENISVNNYSNVNSQIVEECAPIELGFACSPLKSPKSKEDTRSNSVDENDSFEAIERDSSIEHANNHEDDIDLTQTSDTSEELSQSLENATSDHLRILDKINTKHIIEKIGVSAVSSQSLSSLGKKDDVSIDYDDIIIDSNDKGNYSRPTNDEDFENPDKSIEILTKNNSILSNCSQSSEVFDLTDKELDYSLHQSRLEIPKDNFVFGGISIMDDLSNLVDSKKSIDADLIANHVNRNINNELINISAKKNNRCNEISPIKHRRITEIATPQKACSSNMITVTTPKNSELIIKTNDVTPMSDYESMSTPDIHKELDKYGIKPFKRKRAIQLLTHIYNQTHPIIENADELASPPKRHKSNDYNTIPHRQRISPRKLITSPRKSPQKGEIEITNTDPYIGKENSEKTTVAINHAIKGKGKGKGKSSQKQNLEERLNSGIKVIENTKTSVDSNFDERISVPVSKEIVCCPEDWVFQKRVKAKVHSCRVPLHIAFYNYLSSRRDLREAVLCYEPVEIDVIHKDLVGYGHRYDPKDLLRYLDKKCITVKTTDNDARNHKR